MRCPRCRSTEIYESGRDAVGCKVLSWQDDGWPAEVGPVELYGGCYDPDEEYPLVCYSCGYGWQPSAPLDGEVVIVDLAGGN